MDGDVLVRYGGYVPSGAGLVLVPPVWLAHKLRY